MKPGLHIGAEGKLKWAVDASMVITLGGDPRATVFSTPNMILLMERAAREALRPYLEPGEESVGTEVHVEHIGGATIGVVVDGIAKVTAMDANRISFEVEARVGDRVIGRGTHTRAMVSLERLIDNLNKQSKDREHAMQTNAVSNSLPPLTTIQLEVDQLIATVTLNRPKSLNAIDTVMTTELEQVIAWLATQSETVRVVLLQGAGGAFSAGDDVKELRSLPIETARTLSWRQAEMYLALERIPQPVVALVHGDAFGGGCVAACAADLRIATFEARFAMPEIKLGWPPGYGIAQLTALVGKSRALELCLTGEPISAVNALAWGLINEIVPNGALRRRGREIAERMLKLPAEALRQTKRLVHLDEGSQSKVAYRADTESYIRCLELADAREGLAAFAEKRLPKFDGK